MKAAKLAKVAPWIAGGLALAGALACLLPPGMVRGFDLDGFARLPVLEGGRLKPIDSVALSGLRQPSGLSFPFTALAPSLDEIQRQAQAAHPIDSRQRTRFQAAIVN